MDFLGPLTLSLYYFRATTKAQHKHRKSRLGKHGFVLEGWHPNVCKRREKRFRVQTLTVKLDKTMTQTKALFPELTDMPMEIPRSCPTCVGCTQCQYEVQDMTYKEKELDALRAAVSLDPLNNVCKASYPEIDSSLPFVDNKWQAVTMSKSMERQLRKTEMLPAYNKEFQDLLDRGCIEPVLTQEVSDWMQAGGKISYISHHPVLTPEKVTMKCRIVINSSWKNSGNGPTPNVVKGKVQEWRQKFPEVTVEDLQHIAGVINPADLPTRTNCTALDIGKESNWQNGPEFLKLPR